MQVGLLLTQRNQELRVLGLQLLTHFVDAQVKPTLTTDCHKTPRTVLFRALTIILPCICVIGAKSEA